MIKTIKKYYKNKKQWCENIDSNITFFFRFAASGNFYTISAGNVKLTEIVFKMVSR